MSMLSGQIMGIIAACSFNADPATPGYNVQRGFANPGFVRNGAGDYTLTLQDGVNTQTQGVVTGALQGNAPGMLAVEFLSTTTVRVRTLNSAGAAADLDFWLSVQEIGPN
jgi:hypothetical protein